MSKPILFLGVVYIGNKPLKRDTVYGTNLTWIRGGVQQVDAHIANQMAIKHPDVYCLEDSDTHKRYIGGEDVIEPVKPFVAEKTIEERIAQAVSDLRAELNAMPNVKSIEQHEVTAALKVEFESDDRRDDKVQRIVDAYALYLQQNPDKVPAPAAEDEASE